MKTQLFILIFLLLSFVLKAQTNVIYNPEIGSSNTESLAIEKIIRTDSSAVFYMDAYSRPKAWIRIASASVLKGASGKIYKLLSSEGFELDKEVFMPQSGNISFKLRFEPLAKNETMASFSEGDDDGAFKLNNINLTKSPFYGDTSGESGLSNMEQKEVGKPLKANRCRIEGVVVDRPNSSRIKMVKAGGDSRVTGDFISIRNNRFVYEIDCEAGEAYQLIFTDEHDNGAWRPVTFYAEPGRVNIVAYSMERYLENKVGGTPLNEEYQKYQDDIKKIFDYEPLRQKREALMKNNTYHTETAMALHEEISTTKDRKKIDSLYKVRGELLATNNYLTPEAQAIDKEAKQLSIERSAWQLDYVKKHSSIVGYTLLLEHLNNGISMAEHYKTPLDTLAYKNLFSEVYAPAYPNHVNTTKMRNILTSLDRLKVGGHFIDFTAPDLKGKPVTLSKQIKGKVALIDLWASWCGPCRKLSESMIPIYEKYKDKGFTVIAVAREEKNTKAMEQAIEKHKFPWINLVELNDKGRIWEKYGVGNAGGSTFLVDANGKILAVSPDAKQVEKILSEIFK